MTPLRPRIVCRRFRRRARRVLRCVSVRIFIERDCWARAAAITIVAIAVGGTVTGIVWCGFISCVFEESEPLASFRVAVVRSMANERWKRTVVAGIAMVAPYIAMMLATVPFTLFVVLRTPREVHQFDFAIVNAMFWTLKLASVILAGAWAVVFWLDLRVRTEALDLVSAAGEL